MLPESNAPLWTLARQHKSVHGFQVFESTLEFKRMMKTTRVNVIDVRAAEDYAEEHIPFAINLLRDQWPTLKGLSRDKTNIPYRYPQVLHLAARAEVEFSGKGYPAMELDGGWRCENMIPAPSKGDQGKIPVVEPSMSNAASLSSSAAGLCSTMLRRRGKRAEYCVGLSKELGMIILLPPQKQLDAHAGTESLLSICAVLTRPLPAF